MCIPLFIKSLIRSTCYIAAGGFRRLNAVLTRRLKAGRDLQMACEAAIMRCGFRHRRAVSSLYTSVSVRFFLSSEAFRSSVYILFSQECAVFMLGWSRVRLLCALPTAPRHVARNILIRLHTQQ